jgi:hypothetical protein
LPLIEFVRDFLPKRNYKPQRIIDMSSYEQAGWGAVDNGNTALEVFQVLVTLSEKLHNHGPMTDSIEWREEPFELRAARSFVKGALKLVPLTHANLIRKAKSVLKEGEAGATINGQQFVLSKPAGPTGSSVAKRENFDPATDMVIPFWSMPVGSAGAPGTMARVIVKCASHLGNDVEVCCFQNKVALKAGDVLKVEVQAKSNVRQRDGTDPAAPVPKIPKVAPKIEVKPAPEKGSGRGRRGSGRGSGSGRGKRV